MLKVHIVTEIARAKALWDQFSPHKLIDDEWDFRFAFVKHLKFPLHFIVGFDQEEPIGLLALQKNMGRGLLPPYHRDQKEFYEVFGSDDTDDNHIWLRSGYEDSLNDFLTHVPRPTYLAPLAEPIQSSATLYTYRYAVSLTGIKDYEDYIQKKITGETKRTLGKQVRRLQKNHKIEVRYNDYHDVELLIDFNRRRFGESSSFRFDYRGQIFRDLISLYPIEMMTVLVDGTKAGVSYGIRYKNTYIGMNAGVDHTVRDLGKYLSLLQIGRAIELGCDTYDAGKGSGEWKEAFGFSKFPQYELALP